jgi:integrase
MAFSNVTLYRQNSEKEKFIVIYYRHNGNPVRYRTGVVVKPKDFDKKSSTVKSSDCESSSKNEIVKKAHKLLEQIIEDFINVNGIKPNSSIVSQQLDSGIQLKRSKVEANLLECFSDFLLYKSIEFNSPEKSIQSLKDYKSTYNALKDYSKVLNNTIYPTDLTTKIWLDKFNTFLASPRPQVKGYEFLTKKQNDKTRNKRFGVLKNFCTWLKENAFLHDIEAILKYKVTIEEKDYYTPLLSEIKLIQENDFKIVPQQKAIDMWIFACHTGLRYGDIGFVKKSKIKDKNGVQILKLNNQKTKVNIEVPLTKKCIEILEKYDFNIGLMTDQNANKYLHEALATIDVFKEEYEYGVDGDTKPKFDLITFHTARRVFITHLINNNVSVNAIMKMTGHRKISTLQKYINPDYELISENVKIFNEL